DEPAAVAAECEVEERGGDDAAGGRGDGAGVRGGGADDQAGGDGAADPACAGERVPGVRRGGAGVQLDRGRRGERDGAALHGHQRGGTRRRAGGDRLGGGVRGVCVRRDAHVPGEREVHEGAAGDLRGGAAGAGGGDQGGEARGALVRGGRGLARGDREGGAG